MVSDFWKKGLICPWNFLEQKLFLKLGVQGGKLLRYAICDTIYTCV